MLLSLIMLASIITWSQSEEMHNGGWAKEMPTLIQSEQNVTIAVQELLVVCSISKNWKSNQ